MALKTVQRVTGGGGGGGSGTVSNATANQVAWYSATGNTVSGNANLTTTSTGNLTAAGGGLTVGAVGAGALVGLKGSTSGTVTIAVAAAAGTWTMTLPTSGGTAGYVLSTDGSGVTSWVAAGGGGGGNVTAIYAGTGLNASPSSPITTSGTLNIAPSGVTQGQYGNASYVSQVTVTPTGQINAASSVLISIAPSQINATIPNSGLTNSSVTVGNTTIALGGNATSFGNTTFTNIALSNIQTTSLTGYLYGNDGSGNVTASTTIPVASVTGAVSNTVNVIAGTGLSGGGALTGNVTLNISNTAVTSGTYGNATAVSQFTVNSQGQLTNAGNVVISGITIGNTTVSPGGTITTINNLTLPNVTISSVATPITAAQGGTGQTSLTANSVVIGNGTGAVTLVAPGTANNVLLSNGTNWTSTSGSTTIGNTAVNIGGTITTINNLTLPNVTISSVASTFPNSFIANAATTQLGNTTITLGSQINSVGNLTTANVTVNNYVEQTNAVGTISANLTLGLTGGTVLTGTLNANVTFTMPTAVASKSFVFILNTGNAAYTATFTSVKWPSNTAPTITAGSGTTKWDILTFISDGTNWYGNYAQAYQ